MRKFLATGLAMLVILSLLTVGLAQTASAASPGIFSDWHVNANGYTGTLKITSVDGQGNLKGTIFDQQVFGFWDEASQKITFMRVTTAGQPATFQAYTGYLIVQNISSTRCLTDKSRKT